MDEPLINVMVPIYNVEQYLRRCLDSILAQTHKNLRVILVDDGALDGSPRYVTSTLKSTLKRTVALWQPTVQTVEYPPQGTADYPLSWTTDCQVTKAT